MQGVSVPAFSYSAPDNPINRQKWWNLDCKGYEEGQTDLLYSYGKATTTLGIHTDCPAGTYVGYFQVSDTGKNDSNVIPVFFRLTKRWIIF